MKCVTRYRRLLPEESATYQAIRDQIDAELPELLARHEDRMAALDQVHALLCQLKASREAKGLSLADLTELTGMDRSALSKLETGQRANPTVGTSLGMQGPSASGWWSRLPTSDSWRLIRVRLPPAHGDFKVLSETPICHPIAPNRRRVCRI